MSAERIKPSIREYKSTRVHDAVREGNFLLLQELIEGGVDVNILDGLGQTPLDMALANYYFYMFQFLQSYGASFSFQLTPKKEYLDSLKKFLNSNIIVPDNLNLLHKAAQEGLYDVAEYLISKGANVNSTDEYGDTPLHIASYFGNLSIVRMLARNGASIHSRNKSGWTPLHNAAQEGHYEVVEYLISEDADINAETKISIFKSESKNATSYESKSGNLTPLHLAVKEGRLDVADLLIKWGADVNAEDINVCTPLHLASLNGELKIAKQLVKAGANARKKDIHWDTAFHFAVQNGSPKLVALFRKLDPDFVRIIERKYLDSAIIDGDLKKVKKLVKAGADIHSKNANGYTAVLYAILYEHENIEKFLKENGAFDMPVNNGISSSSSEEDELSSLSSSEDELVSPNFEYANATPATPPRSKTPIPHSATHSNAGRNGYDSGPSGSTQR